MIKQTTQQRNGKRNHKGTGVISVFRRVSKEWLLASSCLSVRPHGTARLPLDGFLWNLTFGNFSKICRVSYNSDKNTGYFMWRQMCTFDQGRIKLFGAPRQWKHFRPLFQAVFLSGGGYYPPDWVKHHTSQSQDRNNKYFILYIEFCFNNKIWNVTFL